MKIGVEKSTKIKEKSGQLKISYSLALRYLALEEVLKRIYTSEYRENLYLINPLVVNVESNTVGESLNFYYIKNKKKAIYGRDNPKKELCIQDLEFDFSKKMLIRIMKNDKDSPIKWNAEFFYQEDDVQWNLEAVYEQMKIPITLHIRQISTMNLKKEYMSYKFYFLDVDAIGSKKDIDILIYPRERLAIDEMFEILGKLELIDSMNTYYTLNEILKKQSLSGMHLMEYAKSISNEKTKKIQYVEKLKEYKNYSYMRKRWDKFLHNKKIESDSWEVVMDRIVSFIDPIWNAYCKNSVFVKDWMPGLNRFLG